MIQVAKLVGEDAITLQDGQAVYGQIVPALHRGEPVELDFSGVNVFASPFFNAAIGQLLKDFSPTDLNRLVKFCNLNPLGNGVLRQVIDNAKRYYKEPDYRKAVDDVLHTLAEES